MADILTIETHPSAQPRAHIDTQAPPPNEDTIGTEMALARLTEWAQVGGDISDLLEDGQVAKLGVDAVRQWNIDKGTRQDWLNQAEQALAIAAQENDNEEGQKDFPFENASTSTIRS